jgi:hypothetical protein
MLPTMPPAIRSSKLANLAPDMLSLFPELARAPLVLSLSGLFCLWLWLRCCAVRQPHSEYRTLARFACHRHVATHHAREFAGDSEPEPSPPKALSGRGIGLRELLEQLGLLYPCAGDGDSGADVVANSRREGHSAATAAIDHRHDCDCTSPFTDGPPIDAVVIPFFLRRRRRELASDVSCRCSPTKRFARHLTQDGGIRDAPQCEECRTIQKLMRHRHIGTTVLYCDVSDDTLWNAEELV